MCRPQTSSLLAEDPSVAWSWLQTVLEAVSLSPKEINRCAQPAAGHLRRHPHPLKLRSIPDRYPGRVGQTARAAWWQHLPPCPHQVTLHRILTLYGKLPNYNYHLLLFPEGTDFCQKSKNASDRFAEKNGSRPPPRFVSHPPILVGIAGYLWVLPCARVKDPPASSL